MRLGIIGTGRIADRFVKTALSGLEDVRISAVYNPRISSAERFAKTHGIGVFTDYIKVFENAVDAVYIASPHETHYTYAMQMLQGGKHVLCEKPLALYEKDAEELFSLAGKKGCVLMEAVKTAYCPGFQALVGKVRDGAIGEVKDVEAAFTRLTYGDVRELRNTGYGGSFMEFGSYVLLPIVRLLGTDIKNVDFWSLYGETGVDMYTKAYIDYGDSMATGKVGMGVKSEGQLLVSGTKGYILAESPWWMTRKFEIRYEDPEKKEVFTFPYEGSGLQYETEAFVRAVREAGYAVDKPGDARMDECAAGNDAVSGHILPGNTGVKPLHNLSRLCNAADRILPENTEAGVSMDESVAMAGVFGRFLAGKGETL